MNITEKILRLRTIQGSNAKLAFLQEHRGDELLRKVMYLAYEPTVSYYLTPDAKAVDGVSQDIGDVDALLTALHVNLATRAKTGNAAKTFYQELLARTNVDGRVIIDAVLNRDVKAGIAATSVNKVWPGLVTQVPYMRCSLPAVAKITSWPWAAQPDPAHTFHAYSQIKADGMYANVVTSGDALQVTSRQGSVFLDGPWFDAIREVLAAAGTWLVVNGGGSAFTFQGEMLVMRGGKVLSRKEGNGILNSLLISGEMPSDCQVVFVCWDVIPSGAAVSGGRWTVPYGTRLETLAKSLEATTGDTDAVKIVETRVITTWQEAVDHFADAIARGEEGTIVKRHDAQWMDGDSREQVKMKVDFPVDLKIVGFNPGDPNGKHASTFGSLQCESVETDGGEPLRTGVSGMKDEMRRHIHANRDYYLGKIATVKSNAVITDKTGGYSLYLPRLQEIREDKTTADSLADCIAQFEAALQGKAFAKAGKP